MSSPVSQVLEQEILGEIRRQGIVVWLDKDASYTRFVDDLVARHASGEVLFPVVGFRGSFLSLLFQLEDYGDLREIATELRRAHRTWADRLARAFAGLCQDHGFLPPANLQQRNLFEQVVLPLVPVETKSRCS